MDAYHAIVTKRDTRRFAPEPVSDDDLHHVLQAGRMAGSAKNEQANRIVVVTEQATRERLATCGDFATWLPDVPVVFVLVGPRPFDLGRLAQNLMVAANARGLASCPVTFHRPECVREVLGIPEDHQPSMGVGIGHPGPTDANRGSAPRIPLDELVRWGSWG